MKSTYLEISVSGTDEQREMLLPTMMELGCEGFQETDNSLLCYIRKEHWSDEKYNRLQETITGTLRMVSSNADIRMREIQDQNWNEQWEQSIQPIEIGKRFVVKPSWANYTNPSDRIILHIDPKMSFGTGYHETTRLTLQLVEKYLQHGARVLDVGTGTGILAIAGAKLGASYVVGTDIDEWSIENAGENVLANEVKEIVTISDARLPSFPSLSFSIITANLTLNTNLEMLPQFQRLLGPGGVLLLSGLLRADEPAMINGLTHSAFGIIERLYENEWLAIAAQK